MEILHSRNDLLKRISTVFRNSAKRISESDIIPVSFLSGVGKIQERIVFKKIHNYFNENNLLYKYQSGILPNHTTTLQLIDIYHHIS